MRQGAELKAVDSETLPDGGKVENQANPPVLLCSKMKFSRNNLTSCSVIHFQGQI